MPRGGGRLDCASVIALPPYALTPPTFRFRPLVALAERLPLGGEREVVLATFVAARLAWDWSARGMAAGLAARAAGTRQWVQSLALPAATRGAFQQLADAIGRDDRAAVATAWERVLAVAGRAVDGAARGDFRLLATRLAGGATP